ncbi:BTB/POZ domain-containing protein 8 [Aphelenchoides avenae]|nr:BTB/POZ domain-containing protein 8 [Aphelenchus avenae]
MRLSGPTWDLFNAQREQLQARIATKLRENMAALVGDRETSDLLLVSADGRKLPAHLCILRQRAPVFFQRYVEPTLDAVPRDPKRWARPLEIAVGDVDSAGLAFFIRSVYTEDEIAQLPGEVIPDAVDDAGDRKDDGTGGDHSARTDDTFGTPHKQLNGASFRHRGSEAGASLSKEGSTNTTDSLDSSRCASTSHLYDVTNRQLAASQDMSASFPSPDELQRKIFEQQQSAPTRGPIMTSFRELAQSRESMAMSGYSDRSAGMDENRDAASESHYRETTATKGMSCKFIRLDEAGSRTSGSAPQSPARRPRPAKSIFPMFIGLSGESSPKTITDQISDMTQSLPGNVLDDHEGLLCASPMSSSVGSGSIRGRAMLARRLSVSSLTSLTSIDLTPTHDGPPPAFDRNPASKLASDMLDMYLTGVDTDATVVAEDGELKCHKCVLYATCDFFRDKLTSSSRVELKGYTKATVNFALSFLYGGLTCIPDDVDVWEVLSLAEELEMKELVEVAVLHLKTQKCHFFHRPCASCVSAVFDALPQFHDNKHLQCLFDEAMSWQARHFSRIWKGRVFLHLNARWQKECFEALVQGITEDNVIEVLLGCEKLQVALARVKAQQPAQMVQQMVTDIVEYCTDFLISSFDLIVASTSFSAQGKGLALNLSLIEDVFPTLIHSLCADVAIRTYINLKDLIIQVHTQPRSPRKSANTFNVPDDEWSPRFLNLCRRLYELTDKHLLHYAASVVKAEAWSQLSEAEQNRIQECGIFVEMRLPRAPPPQLSSFNRAYKRSSSVGLQQYPAGTGERARSLERPRPISTYPHLVDGREPLEAILEREKSQIEMHRRSASLKANSKESVSGGELVQHAPSKIPSKIPSNVPRPESAAKAKNPPTASPTKRRPQSKSPPPRPRSGTPKDRQQLRRKSSSKQLTGGSPVKTAATPHPPQVEEFWSERQHTHTVMTVEQNLEAGIVATEGADGGAQAAPLGLVGKGAKPKSVVRPMPKPPLSASSSGQFYAEFKLA